MDGLHVEPFPSEHGRKLSWPLTQGCSPKGYNALLGILYHAMGWRISRYPLRRFRKSGMVGLLVQMVVRVNMDQGS